MKLLKEVLSRFGCEERERPELLKYLKPLYEKANTFNFDATIIIGSDNGKYGAMAVRDGEENFIVINEVFIRSIKKLGPKSAKVILSGLFHHELVHIEQQVRGDLVLVSDTETNWKGTTYKGDMRTMSQQEIVTLASSLPYEIEAYVRQFIFMDPSSSFDKVYLGITATFQGFELAEGHREACKEMYKIWSK